jgi:hypothetical protein
MTRNLDDGSMSIDVQALDSIHYRFRDLTMMQGIYPNEHVTQQTKDPQELDHQALLFRVMIWIRTLNK